MRQTEKKGAFDLSTNKLECATHLSTTFPMHTNLLMKTTKLFFTAMLIALSFSACQEQPVTTKKTQGQLVYEQDTPCMGVYFDAKLGEDFDSALQNLIRSRTELNAIGDSLYVKQMEMRYLSTEDGSRLFVLLFFEKNAADKVLPLRLLYAAHDAIDTNGNHYEVIFCDGPIGTEDSRKPEGSYSFQECVECYLMLVGNFGADFETAWQYLEPDRTKKMKALADEYGEHASYNSEDVVERHSSITVKNCEIKGVEFTLIDFYMYSYKENDYIYVANYGALDSQGNLYKLETLPVY
ncbi:MAG: hypothetical protein IJ581_05560 [Paludibacteraceae bacterium]|nr:hypothetical protein [Paludibacteraceae bacterium]